jgi:hypothetical protein
MCLTFDNLKMNNNEQLGVEKLMVLWRESQWGFKGSSLRIRCKYGGLSISKV